MSGTTPGPWRWNMNDDGSATLYGGDSQRPYVIADFWRNALRLNKQNARRNSDLKAEQIANLDLCAAAPDLLAAAIHAEAVLSIVEPRSNKAEYLETLGEFRAAIAKATGGQP